VVAVSLGNKIKFIKLFQTNFHAQFKQLNPVVHSQNFSQ
jgi:hypothetical protein